MILPKILCERMLAMSIHRYLLEYILETIFHGNQSSCAKELGMEYNDFHKFRRRMAEGSFSARIAEALLLFCWRENIDMQNFFEKYSESRMGEDIEDQEKTCNDLSDTLESVIQLECRNAHNMAEMMRPAEDFGEKIRRYICDENICERESHDVEKCPVRLLHQLIDKLKKKYGENNV